MNKILKIHMHKEELQEALNICNEELSRYKFIPHNLSEKIHYDFYFKLKKEIENNLMLMRRNRNIF